MFGNYDKAYDEALKPYIDNLKAATGVTESRGQVLGLLGGNQEPVSFYLFCVIQNKVFKKALFPVSGSPGRLPSARPTAGTDGPR